MRRQDPARATRISKARSAPPQRPPKPTSSPGERYRRLVKRRGKLNALVAVARSILVIVWHLLANPATRFRDLGPDHHTNRVATEQRLRNHIAQFTAVGYRVTLEPASQFQIDSLAT